MTLHQMFGSSGMLRAAPAARVFTASSTGRVCYPVTPADVEQQLGCVGCGLAFAAGSYYTERPQGVLGNGQEVVEVVCLACAEQVPAVAPAAVHEAAAAPAPPTPAPVVLGQNRDLPDPDGWVRCSIPVVVVEGMETGDGRLIDVEGLSHRALPQALMSLSVTGPGGHDGATVFGRIDQLERIPGPDVLNIDTGEPFPEGTFVWRADEVYVNPEHPDYALAYYGALTGVSVDLAETVADFMEDEAHPEGGTLVLRRGRIAAATVCTIPAFPGAYIVLPDDAPVPGAKPAAMTAAARDARRGPGFRLDHESALCASCVSPPAEWFQNPQLDEVTPIQVTDDGRVFGHVADWTTCHVGLPGCQTTPRSRTGYAYFLTGYVVTSDGQQVNVGQLTLGGGHAGLDDDYRAAAEHYDSTSAAVADVHVGEDAFGVWCAGALRPGVGEDQVRVLRASPLSGDWRPIPGVGQELMAAHCVNVPGFPIPRVRARVASGQPTALIASVHTSTSTPTATTATTKKEQQMAPPKGIPGQEKSTGPDETPAAAPGDLVTVSADGDLVGTVVGADGDNVTVEVVVAASMVAVTEPEDAVTASLPPEQLRLLRTIRGHQLLTEARR